MKQRFKWPPLGDRGLWWANTALFIVAVMLLQGVVFGFFRQFSLYLYTEERYTHEIGSSMDEKLSDISLPVSIRFCTAEEDIEKDVVHSLVYQTAKQLEARHPDKIRVSKSLNIYTDNKEAAAIAEKAEAAVNKESVIIETAESMRLLQLSDFFILDNDEAIVGYNGEEVLSSMMLWVQKPPEEHETVYFTTGHGEMIELSGLATRLMLSGYLPAELELASEEIPEDAFALILSNPIYDLESSAEGSSASAELDRLSTYVKGGGKLIVTLDNAKLDADPDSAKHLSALRDFLSNYGITPGNILSDMENAVSQDGKVILLSTPVGNSRILAREPAAVSLNADNPVGATHKIYAESFASAAVGGVSAAYPVAVTATTEGGGQVFFGAAGSLFYSDALNTDAYGNRELLYTVLSDFGCTSAPQGCTILPVENERLENLTRGESNLFFILTTAVLPCVTAVAATVILLRRRKR